MSYEVDDLLDHVDKWKLKLYHKLKDMTAEQESDYWMQARQNARAAGLRVAEPEQPAKPPVKQRRRAMG